MAQEKVVEMIDPRPSPKCKDSTGDSGCGISFDRSQVTDFIDEEIQVDQPSEKEGESQVQGEQQPKQRKVEEGEPEQARPEAMQSVTVLFQEPAAGSEGDDPQSLLAKEVKDLFADESTGGLIIALVSPAAVQKLLGTPDMTSMSDMRSAMVANSQFTGLVSKLGQVLSRYTGIRGIVDIQGNLLK